MKTRFGLLCVLSALVQASLPSPALGEPPDDLVLFDPETAEWHTRSTDGSIATFVFGKPGDLPLWGDWDCDGFDSAAVLRPSSGALVIRGDEDSDDAMFEFGVSNAVPLAGDWNGDGCDTVSAYRSERVLILNQLGGEVEDEYFLGIAGDVPIAGDFDGDGISSVGVYRTAASHVFLRNTLETGAAEIDYSFGEAGDYVAVGDWNGDGVETLALYRPSDRAFHISFEHQSADRLSVVEFGAEGWVPPGGLQGLSPGGLQKPTRAVRGRVLLFLILATVIGVTAIVVKSARTGPEPKAGASHPKEP